jgi:small subunit ribosomal protein S1
MSENGNLPVAELAPAAEPEASEPAAADAAAAGPEASAGSDPEPAGAVAESAESAAAPAPSEAKGAEGKARERKAGRKGAPAKGGKRGGARRGTRSEEFVTPTPEELAGIPSEGVRLAVEQGLPVAGKVIGWNQGGFHVAVDGITSFCPRSSMELGAPREPAQYLDQIFHFRVLRVEEKGHRLILSRAAALREERRHQAVETRAKLSVGLEVEGRVVALTDFGAFVDLGGVEGLIHVSELRHGRVSKPAEVLTMGQEVRARVIKLGTGNDRVSLSIKALEPDPWQEAAAKFTAGAKFSGTVLRKTEFGWFVELAPGVEGLLHPSQLAPGMKPEDPALAPGATVEGWVRELDLGRKRVSLALRETPSGDPWHGVEGRYPEGKVVEGVVEKIQPFGAFITLEPGLTGLLPASEMGMPRGASIGKAYPVGKKVSLQVAQVDARRKRISLTLEGKTLEGSRADYQAYVKKNRRDTGLSALAAAFERLKGQSS